MRFLPLALLVLLARPLTAVAADPPKANTPPAIFARQNLVAWCIVPFDAKKRSPEERAAMLARLGFKRYAYDWRAEHLPTFDREVAALKKHGIELTAVWFPANLGPDARALLKVIEKSGLKPQLWVMMGEPPGKDQAEKVQAAAKTIRPIAEEAGRLGCKVALYNHGGWFGEPENQLAIIESLKRKNVGIVYNQHHGHEHLTRFPELLNKMLPHLLSLNLNGMEPDGDRHGKKILPLGQGSLDLSLLKTVATSDYKGPIGILGHTNDDAEERLTDNLDGLDWLLPQLTGKPAGPKPKPRTTVSAAPSAPATAGWLAAGKPEYRTPPLTVECRVRLTGKQGYNVIVASDTKRSAAHWELFTTPGDGRLTAYLPGRMPDHVRSAVDVCDGKAHTVAMQFEEKRIRLFVDGKEVAAQAMKPLGGAIVPGDFAFARLVEGGIGCDGRVLRVRISAGVREPANGDDLAADEKSIGTWQFGEPGTEAIDASKLKNHARPAKANTPASNIAPPPGPNLKPTDPKWKATLIDRSPDDAYMAVKADGTGCVFVGGREKVFVFEPDSKGGFRPRRELLQLPPDSIVIGLEVRGYDLYVLASHGLYLVPGGRVRRTGLAPKRILWGVPLDYHVSFHCLAWGPDGSLILDHGDPLLNYGDWTRPDHWGHWTLFAGPKGIKTPYTGAGAVLKVRPDGSAPQVLARGLRGPVGLAFDSRWNLFTNDNDHESRPDQYAPAKLLHVTPQAEFGWPRGWMATKSPDRADLLDSVHPALGRGVPCDLAYYDEPAAPSLRGSLLMCRWDRYAVTRYPIRAKGAGFVAEELVFAQGENQCRPTGVAVDTTGRVFVTNHYLGGNVVTPHCVSDLVVLTPPDGATRQPFDEIQSSADDLWKAIDGPSWEVRRRAHTELLRRKSGLERAVERLNAARDDEPAAAHLPWLAAAAGGEKALAKLIALADDRTRPALRLQSLRTLATFSSLDVPARVFVDALTDPSPAIQLTGLEGLFRVDVPLPSDTVGKLAGSPDAALRQTAATLLARRARPDDLDRLSHASNPRTRLGVILATGTRLTVPRPDALPPAGMALQFPKESPFFSHKLRFAGVPAPVDLTTLGPIGSYTTAQRWAAGTHTAEEERLFKLLVAALDDSDDLVRSQAAYYLGWLRDPRSESGVNRVRLEARTRGLKDRPSIAVKAAWQIGRFAAESTGQAVERGPIDLTATVAENSGKLAWRTVNAEGGGLALPPGKGVAYVYFQVQSRDRQTALLVTKSNDLRVWHNGRAIAPEFDGSLLLDLQPGGNDVLIRSAGGGPLELAMRTRTAVTIGLPEKADGAALAERLKAAKGSVAIAPEFLKIDWSVEGRRGDTVRGRKLFGTLGCVKCHAVTADQTGGGAPSLAEAGKRFTPAHLAESVLLPDRLVADEFRNTRLTTTDGKVLLGLVVRESPSEIELLFPDTTRRVVKVADVEERKPVASSPMPAGLVKSPDELRDLLAYLLSSNPLPP